MPPQFKPSVAGEARADSPFLSVTSATPTDEGKDSSPGRSPRSLTPEPLSPRHSISHSVDYSTRKGSTIIDFGHISNETTVTTELITTELSPSYLIIESRKDSFAQAYEQRRRRSSTAAIDSTRIRNISKEDLRTILTIFPVGGSEGKILSLSGGSTAPPSSPVSRRSVSRGESEVRTVPKAQPKLKKASPPPKTKRASPPPKPKQFSPPAPSATPSKSENNRNAYRVALTCFASN